MAPTICVAVAGVGATPGGIAAVSRNLLEALLSWRADPREIEILSFLERDADRPHWLPRSVQFRGYGGRRLAFSAAVVRRMLMRRDFIFDHVTLALPILPLMRSGWVRSVVFAHGSESWRRIRKSSRLSFRRATLVLANSEYTRKKMLACGVSGNIIACPLGLAADVSLRSSAPPPMSDLALPAADGVTRTLSPHALLLVGRMLAAERGKGHDQLLTALPLLHGSHPDTQLVFAGPGDDRERLQHRAQELGVAHAVFLPGFITRDALDSLFAAAYAYVMPSRQEGFGLVYLEAMNHAKVCVGCRNDGAEDVIVDGETGLLVDDPDDIAELVQALQGLLGNPGRAMCMGQAGFGRLHTHFTAEQYRQRLLDALRTVLS